MKKWFVLLAVLVLTLGLVGCTPGLNITVTPNPIEFNSGTDVVNATVTATATGMGPLTISRVTAVLYKQGTTETLFSYDTKDDPEFKPIEIPMVYNGLTKTIELKDYIGQKTVNDLIAENGAEVGITTYADLQNTAYTLKVEVTAGAVTFNEVSVIFH